MMKAKYLSAMVMMALCVSVSAQKDFTLDDLMGSNAYNVYPKNLYTTWWGNVPLISEKISFFAFRTALVPARFVCLFNLAL